MHMETCSRFKCFPISKMVFASYRKIINLGNSLFSCVSDRLRHKLYWTSVWLPHVSGVVVVMSTFSSHSPVQSKSTNKEHPSDPSVSDNVLQDTEKKISCQLLFVCRSAAAATRWKIPRRFVPKPVHGGVELAEVFTTKDALLASLKRTTQILTSETVGDGGLWRANIRWKFVKRMFRGRCGRRFWQAQSLVMWNWVLFYSVGLAQVEWKYTTPLTGKIRIICAWSWSQRCPVRLFIAQSICATLLKVNEKIRICNL